MDGESVTIYCWDFNSFSFDLLAFMRYDVLARLQNQGYKISYVQNSTDYIIDFKINQTNVKIITTYGDENNYDVCLIKRFDQSGLHNDHVKREASICKVPYPTVPLIVIGDADGRNKPEHVKEAELSGWKMFNQTMGDKLAREVGAIKYIEYSWKSGRGFRIILDEIYFAYLGKLKEDEERRKKQKCIVL